MSTRHFLRWQRGQPEKADSVYFKGEIIVKYDLI